MGTNESSRKGWKLEARSWKGEAESSKEKGVLQPEAKYNRNPIFCRLCQLFG